MHTRGIGVISWHNFLSLYLPALTLSLANGIAAPALPVYAKSFEVTFGVASLIFVVHEVGGLAATLPTGFLMDRIGRRKVLLAGPILVAVASVLTAFATSFPELLVYRFVGGWARQMWMMSRLAVIADTGGDRQRGRQVTGLVGMESTGRLLGPAVGGLLAAGWDVRVPFIVHGVLSLLAIAPSFKLVKETAPNRTRAGAHGPSGAEGDTGRLRDLLIAPVLMFFLAQVLASFTRGSLHSGIPHLYAVYQYGVGPETIGFLAATAGALGIPIILTSGHLMDRFGRTFTVVPGFILLGVGLFIMAGTALAELPFAAYAATFYFVQMAQGLTAGNMQVIGSDIAPPHLRGRFFGIWRLMGEIGVASSPAVFGVVAEHFGYAPPFAILGITAWLSAVILGTQVRGMLKRKGLTGSAREVAAGT